MFLGRFSSLESLDLAKSHVKIVSLFEMIAPSPPMEEESPNLPNCWRLASAMFGS